MKARFVPYDLPLTRPYTWAKGRQERRRGLLVQAQADGRTGWGEVAPPPHEDADLEALAALGAKWCGGLDALSPTALRALDLRATHARLRAGIATAVLDLQARDAEVPLATWLVQRTGATAPPLPDQVPVNALVTAVDPEDAARQARGHAAAGFTCLKIKCGADREADRARVAAVHEAAPRAVLRLDANEAWDPAWAAGHLLALDEAAGGIDYVEQPLPAGGRDRLDDLARLRRETGVRVALDEGIAGPTDVQAAVAAGAADVLVLKPQRLGGPDRAYQTLRMARAAGLSCTVTNSLETAVGRTAAWHVAALGDPAIAAGLATGGFLARDVADGPRVADGRMDRPSGPGLGVAVAEDDLAHGAGHA